MCLILEEEQPRLVLAVDFNVDHDCACVDLFGLVKFVELAGSFQMPYGDGRDIHQRYRLVPAELLSDCEIILVGLLEQRVFKCDAVDHGVESRVPAVIRPVGVDHAKLRDSRVSLLNIAEVLHAHLEVSLIHGQPHRTDGASYLGVCHVVEALEHLHLCRNIVVHFESLRLVKRSLSRLDRIDQITHHRVDVCRHQVAEEHIDSRVPYGRPFSAAYYLHALLR